jgi:hypothetical protein
MRRVAGLAAVAVLLTAYLLFTDRGGGRLETLGSGIGTPLLAGFDRPSIRRLSIARGAGSPFSLERQAPGAEPLWRVLPAGWAADGPAVEELLIALDFAEIARTADTTPAAAGLSPAAIALTIDAAAGGSRSLRFGHPDAGGGGVFVAIGDQDTVRVAPRHLLDLVDRPAEVYRAPAIVQSSAGSRHRSSAEAGAEPPGSRGPPLLDFAHFDVRRLRQTAVDGTVELVSDDGESWRWATPPGAGTGLATTPRSIDASNATRVASALGNLRPERLLVLSVVRAPMLQLEVDVVPPGQTSPTRHRLLIEMDGQKGCRGQLDQSDAFTLPPATCDDLALPLVAHGAGD